MRLLILDETSQWRKMYVAARPVLHNHNCAPKRSKEQAPQMKFIAVYCAEHGYILLNPKIHRGATHRIECTGGHLFDAAPKIYRNLKRLSFRRRRGACRRVR